MGQKAGFKGRIARIRMGGTDLAGSLPFQLPFQWLEILPDGGVRG